LLGLDTETRDANRVAELAIAWLLDWRMERSAAPFFLFIDFRKAAPPLHGESLLERSDARLGDILEHLLMLGVQDFTLVLVLREREVGMIEATRPARAILRTPPSWPRSTRATQHGSLRAGQLGDFLIEASQSNSTTAVPLPRSLAAP